MLSLWRPNSKMLKARRYGNLSEALPRDNALD